MKNYSTLAAKQWKLTQLGSEALVLHQVLAVLRLEVHGGLDVQSEVERHPPADDQTLRPKKVSAVVAGVLLKVQVIAFQLQSCVYGEGCDFPIVQESSLRKKQNKISFHHVLSHSLLHTVSIKSGIRHRKGGAGQGPSVPVGSLA